LDRDRLKPQPIADVPAKMPERISQMTEFDPQLLLTLLLNVCLLARFRRIILLCAVIDQTPPISFQEYAVDVPVMRKRGSIKL